MTNITQLLEQAEKCIREAESKRDLTNEEIKEIQNFWHKLNPDPDCWYVTKEEAYKEYTKYYGNDISFNDFEQFDDDGYKRWGWMSSSTNC